MPRAKLRILSAPLAGQEFSLPPHPAIVGRSPKSDIIIADPSVSRQHVRAELRDGHCVLTDLGSQNGIVIDGHTLREVAVPNGGRFELGDIEIEFVLEPEAEAEATVAAPPPAVAPGGEFVPAAASAPPAERPVYVDDLFGPAVAAEEPGPGPEEKAAVQSARSAGRFVAFVAVLLALGAVAWHFAGRKPVQPEIRPVMVQVGETRVIDLGLRVREVRGKPVTSIDLLARYTEADIIEPGDDLIARFRLDGTGFMAVITGRGLGSTDVTLAGRRGPPLTVRILVHGKVSRPPEPERLTRQERLAQARLLLAAGREARKAGDFQMYLAMQRFAKARDLLDPVKATPEGHRLHREADRLYAEANRRLREAFGKYKRAALRALRDGDTRTAAKDIDTLRKLVPDKRHELHQKASIIFDRMLEIMRRERK